MNDLDDLKREKRRLKKTPACDSCGRRDMPAELLNRKGTWDSMVAIGQKFAVTSSDVPLIVRIGDRGTGRTEFVKGGAGSEKLAFAAGVAGLDLPIRTLIDVGAGIGSVSIHALRQGVAESAFAIEPDDDALRLLRANIALNGVEDRMRVSPQALGGINDEFGFLVRGKDSSASRIFPSFSTYASRPEAVRVALNSLDEVVPDLDPARDLVWIDTGGSEGAVLQGALKCIALGVPVVLQFTPRAIHQYGNYSAVADAVAAYGAWFDVDAADTTPHSLSYLSDHYQSSAVAPTGVTRTILLAKP
ncbi:MAG: FkbM family methyltransferase [Actinomycetota bacterium]|nr:FkbM family methyltransferase [Actinomycetota bacterium]